MTKEQVQKILEELLLCKQIDTGEIVDSIWLAEEYEDNSGTFYVWLKDISGLYEFYTNFDLSREELENDVYHSFFKYVDHISKVKDAKNTLEYLLRIGQHVSGEVDESENYVERLIEKFGELPTFLLLREIFIDTQNGNVVVGVLHILSHKSEWENPRAYERAVYMANLGLSNRNIDIAEYAIKCFENWDDESNIRYLEEATVPPFLDDYRKSVIQDLRDKCKQKKI